MPQHQQPTSRTKKNFYEKTAWQQNWLVCGVDEVGRGCLAGPLVVGAAILTTPTCSRLVQDSKLLTENERNEAYDWLCHNALFTTVAIPPHLIDKHNIYQATLLGMRRACLSLFIKQGALESIRYILVDAMPLTFEKPIEGLSAEIAFFPHGEQRSISIAAASIVAKVTRDRMMARYQSHIPWCSLATHKGYGTEQHYREISQHNLVLPAGRDTVSLIHRVSFLSKRHELEERDATQSTLL